MIPVQLKVHNFMSYGQNVPPLSFAAFHLACLTGDNGNGKSALLDAITWVIWGQARGVDKNGAGMDDLVRLGQDYMEVEFIFRLEGDTYRVIRKRDKRRGLSILEFQLADGDKYRTISGDKIAETQKQILQVLKMDYETFTNSALVLQGKADTFTQQKPNERKRILGEILGLGLYDDLDKKAREKAKNFEQEARHLQQQIFLLKQETSQKSLVQTELSGIEKENLVVTEEIKTLEAEHEMLLQQKQEYDNARTKVEQLSARIKKEIGELEKNKQHIATIKEKINNCKLLINREKEIIIGFQQFSNKAKLKDELERKQAKYYEYITSGEKLSGQIEEKKKILNLKIDNLQNEIKDLEILIKDKEDKQNKALKLRVSLKQLEETNYRKAELENKLKTLETEEAVFRAKIPELESKLEELKQNYLTLKKAPKCPLCSTSLESKEGKEKVLDLITIEGKQIRQAIDEIEKKVSNLKGSNQKVKDDINFCNHLLEKQRGFERELTIIERDLTSIADAEIRLRSRQQQLEANLGELRDKTYAQLEALELVQINNYIKDLSFDKDLYFQLIAEVEQYKIYSEQFNQLNRAKESLEQHNLNLAFYEDNLVQKIGSMEEDKELVEILTKRVEALKDIPEHIGLLTDRLRRVRQSLSLIEQTRGALQEKIKHCLKLEKEQHSKELELQIALLEKHYYSELAQAFGKKGIQAIIIENAIPELQDEANKLLNKMTDGRLNVALITQKGNKKGTVVETLDIQISDEIGTRKYEMYSGGEAFRVNFALRIALSKLLAKRAGARLQTLIIDEGFGTQDGKGKERLIELITAIQDDFAKILVITHIQELKDAFPVHLEVRKDQEGSTVTII